MIEIATIVAALVANGLTKLFKPKDTLGLTQEALDARKTMIRLMNLAFATVAMVVAYWVIPGAQLDTGGLTANLEEVFTIILTFGFGQGAYALWKG